ASNAGFGKRDQNFDLSEIYPQGSIVTHTRQILSIWAESDSADVCSVARQGGRFLALPWPARGYIPKLDRTILTGRSQACTVRAKSDSPHQDRMSSQDQQ